MNTKWMTWALGCTAALILTLFINAPTITGAIKGIDYSDTHMGTVDEDRAYYYARVREVADGYPLIGNAALKEHRDEVSPNGFVEVLTGGLMYLTGWSIETTISFTNFLFPFFILLFTFLWIRGLTQRNVMGLIGMLIVCFTIFGLEGILRESSPKVTMLFPSLYLTLLFVPDEAKRWHLALRGALIGMMMYTYHYHWTVLFVFEGLLVLRALFIERKKIIDVIKDACWIWIPLLIIACPYVSRLLSKGGDPIAAEMWMRFGAIPTRFIAAPILQSKLIGWLLILIAARLIGLAKDKRVTYLLWLLVASLIAVNSNLITGVEAEFEGHYGRFVLLFACAAFVVLVKEVLSPLAQRWVVSAVITCCAVLLVILTPRTVEKLHANQAHWESNRTPEVMQWLNENVDDESVILAPFRLSSLIPVHTSHYVWLNYGARSFYVSEYELIERYLTQVLFFPEDTETMETGVRSVFGNGPPVLWAKRRRLHNLNPFKSGPFKETIGDVIVNQEHRQLVERALNKPDLRLVNTALNNYQLDYVISDQPLPQRFARYFSEVTRIGDFLIYKSRN